MSWKWYDSLKKKAAVQARKFTKSVNKAASAAKRRVTNTVSSAVKAVKKTVRKAVTAVKKKVTKTVAAIKKKVANAVTAVKKKLVQAKKLLRSAVKATKAAAKKLLTKAKATAKKALKTAKRKAKKVIQAGKAAGRQAKAIVKRRVGKVFTDARKLKNNLTQHELVKRLKKDMNRTLLSTKSFVKGARKGAWGAVLSTKDSVVALATDPVGTAKGVVTGVWATVSNPEESLNNFRRDLEGLYYQMKDGNAEAQGQLLANLVTSAFLDRGVGKVLKVTPKPQGTPKPKETQHSTQGASKPQLALPESQMHKAIENIDSNKIHHIINGSKNTNHQWEKVVPNKNWGGIKKVITEVMESGGEVPYKKVSSKVKIVNGEFVQVVYVKLSNGTIKISDAWVK